MLAKTGRVMLLGKREGETNTPIETLYHFQIFFIYFFTLKLRIETLRPKEKTCAKDGGGSYCWERWRQNSFFYKGKVKSWVSKPFRRHEKQ